MWDCSIKNVQREIDEVEHGLVKKATEKLKNQISSFGELECEKSLNRNK